jgi:hypothetical protein
MSQFENQGGSYNPNNPYSYSQTGPIGSNPTSSDAGREDSLRTQFMILGIIFIFLSVMGVIFASVTVLGNIVQIANGQNVAPPNLKEAEKIGFYIGFYGIFGLMFVSILAQLLMLLAGINMLRLRGRATVYVGAIAAVIPIVTSCCLLGTPFGIWALIALSYPGSKRIFQ